MARNFDIDFLDSGDPDDFGSIGALSLHNIRMALKHGFECLSILVRRRPDVVYVPIARGLWGFIRDLLFLVPARLFGVRTVVHLRAGRFDLIHDHGSLGRMIARIGLAGVDRALVLGTSVKEIFGSSIPPQNIRIVPNGLPLDGWEAEQWQRERTKIDGFHIAYIANLYRAKGAHVMLEAVARIREAVPDVTVSFAGDWGSESFRAECEELVERLDLARSVRFVGRVGDAAKRELLASAHLAAFVPVDPEGQPWVVLEAMASGLAVVGTSQGTIAEMIVDGETGTIVPPEDSKSLADAIIALARNPVRRNAMGDAGRSRVETVYREEAVHGLLVGAMHESIDQRVVRQPRRGRVRMTELALVAMASRVAMSVGEFVAHTLNF